MKIAVQCASPLLQKSLEIFLKPHLSSLKQCDVVLRDRKVDDGEHKSIYISSDDDADIKKPFSEAELKLVLHKFINQDKHSDDEMAISAKKAYEVTEEDGANDFKLLEARIDQLTQEYKENIIKTVKAFYEK